MRKKARQSNLELLRIISMIFIVMSHCDELFGLSNLYRNTIGLNKLITDWLHIGGQIGVGCFILISGYFMIEQRITIKKVLRLTGEVWFYTISIWLVWIVKIICLHQIELKSIIKETIFAFFPILFSHYWFVTAYIILMILSPFFNKLIFVMNKQQYKRFMIVLIVVFVVIAGGFPMLFSGMSEGRLIPVFVLYFLAGYLKRFENLSSNNVRKHLQIAVLFYVLLFLSFYLITYLGVKLGNDTIESLCYFYRELNSPFVMIICTELFIAFSKMNMNNSKIINSIAGKTFGVYLIHKNRLISGWLLPKLFPIYLEKSSIKIFIYSLFSVLLIYIVCTAIDLLRQVTVEKLWLSFLNHKIDGIQSKISTLFQTVWVKLKKRLFKYYGVESKR